jgi:CRISPR-associated endoribonuclease Cas6
MKILPEGDLPFTVNHSSLYHGVLMEQTDAEYAEILHDVGLKPYTQHIEKYGDKTIWIVTTLTKEAKERIVDRIYRKKPDYFELKDKNIKLRVESMRHEETTYDSLVEKTYFGENSRLLDVQFKTPTAFKSEGTYVYFPDVWKIFNSLMKKFNAFAQDSSMDSHEVLEHLDAYTKIYKYNLKSTVFHLEGVKIPSFMGLMQFRINGPKELVNLAHLLMRYGEYSGIGIKTALGMGCVKYLKKETERGEKVE